MGIMCLPFKVKRLSLSNTSVHTHVYTHTNTHRLCFHLVLKCILGDLITSGQLRHIAIYLCAYYASSRCPADHLCSDFVTAYGDSSGHVSIYTTKDMQ